MSRFYDIKSNQKPKWYQFRFRLANWLVRVAKWIHPQNPEVLAFWHQSLLDYIITGKMVTRVDMGKEGADESVR